MHRTSASKSGTHAIIKVGDAVVIRLGTARIPATVVEDRGVLGVGGRQIVAVRVGDEVFEVPAEELEPKLQRRRATELIP